MAGLDERLRHELERAARPADPSGVYEHLIRRRERRRILRTVQTGLLAVAVVAGSAAGVYGLTQVFRFGADRAAAPAGGGRIVYSAPGVGPSPTPPDVIAGGAEHLDIFVVDTVGGSPVHITNDPPDDTDPAVSPDGMTIAFCSERAGVSGIYLMPIEGGVPELLTDLQGACYPAWSPDGQRIAFSANGPGRVNTDIYVVDVAGGEPRRITSGPDVDLEPAWSPDGGQLLFYRLPEPPEEAAEADIFRISGDGSNLLRLTDTPGLDLHPSWSPDGSRIVFQTQRFVQDREAYPGVIAIMNADGSGAMPITPQLEHGVDAHPSWSPDGSLIAFSRISSDDDEKEGIYTIRPDGTDLDLVVGGTAPYCCPAPVWQPLPSQGLEPSPSPPSAVEPTPTSSAGRDIGLGLRLCDVTSVRGHFLGEGGETQTAFVGGEPTAGGCPTGEEITAIAAIDITGDALADVASEPFECQYACRAYAAPDVDGDGTDELLVQNVAFTIVGLRLFDLVPNEDRPALVMAMVEPPGDAALGMEGFDGSGPPQFWIGGDAFIADSLRCEPSPNGRVLISVTAESLPHDSPDAVWQVHETVFELEEGMLRVVEARDFEEPVGDGTPSFLSTAGCGADLGAGL